YEQVIQLEQDRLIYQARLQARFGRSWRRKAPVESLMPLRLARFGVPLAEAGPAGLAAAGIDTSGRPHAAQEAAAAEMQRLDAQQSPAPDAGEERIRLGPPQEHPLLPAVDEPEATVTALREEDGSYSETYFWAYLGCVAQIGTYPTAHQFAAYLMDAHGITQPTGAPLTDKQLRPMTLAFEQRDAGRSLPSGGAAQAPDDQGDHADERAQFYCDAARQYAAENGKLSDVAAYASFLAERFGLAAGDEALDEKLLAAHLGAVAAEASTGMEEQPDPAAESTTDTCTAEQDDRRAPVPEQQVRSRRVNAPLPDGEDETEPRASAGPAAAQLTTVDRYYLAWRDYQTTHGTEPSDKELSVFLADCGVTGRNGCPVDPSTLRRYLPQFRIYVVWDAERQHSEQPQIVDVVERLAHQGVRKRHIKDPAKAAWREHEVQAVIQQADFERRYQAVIVHNASLAS
ncbi:hypothetical protein ACWFRU_41990, partial [Streptomyces sp. NPDC055099]